MKSPRSVAYASRIDWTGAVLAVLALGGAVFALLSGRRLVRRIRWCSAGWRSARARSSCSRIVDVAPREPDGAARAVLPVARRFSLANILTLPALRGARDRVLSGTAQPHSDPALAHRGRRRAAAVPAHHVCVLRWSGGLASRSRQPPAATIGPAIAALGSCCTRPSGSRRIVLDDSLSGDCGPRHGDGDDRARRSPRRRWAPSIHRHAGAPSRVNNAVATIAGLLGDAVFSVVAGARVDRSAAAAAESARAAVVRPRAALDFRELGKWAGPT